MVLIVAKTGYEEGSSVRSRWNDLVLINSTLGNCPVLVKAAPGLLWLDFMQTVNLYVVVQACTDTTNFSSKSLFKRDIAIGRISPLPLLNEISAVGRSLSRLSSERGDLKFNLHVGITGRELRVDPTVLLDPN